jgi:hypothetical protein
MNIMLFHLAYLQRGAFPIYPSKGSLIFVPLSFELPLSLQLQEVDMVLHKITDEIVKIDPNCSIDFPKGISFSTGMSEIIRYSLRPTIEFVLSLVFYVYIQINGNETRHIYKTHTLIII